MAATHLYAGANPVDVFPIYGPEEKQQTHHSVTVEIAGAAPVWSVSTILMIFDWVRVGAQLNGTASAQLKRSIGKAFSVVGFSVAGQLEWFSSHSAI